MNRRRQPSTDSSIEPQNSQPHAESDLSTTHVLKDQLLLELLTTMDFSQEEVNRLLKLREHLYENSEMLQRMADDSRLQFARWLYEQGEIHEN
ncbi:MAG: hypothetical protein IMW89_12930 [Ktedonobacteraceae bacterium]|nr:hypothetical protein [Ktedonobacteraceae bacterium]